MKHLSQIALLLVLSIVFTNCQKKKASIVYDKKYINEIKEIRKDLSFYLARNFIPGGTFAIAKDGKLIYSEGLGFASKDLEVPMSRDHKQRIANVSELFTAIIFQKMVEEGVLHPDSSIQHYLPDFPEKEFKLTLKYLPNHISGIRPLNNNESSWNGINVSLQKGIDNFKNDPLEYEPGWFQDLSEFNYNLLGAAMEKAANKQFPQLLKEYITDTLNLTNTLVDNPFIIINGRNDFYDRNIVSQTVNATFRDLRYLAPSKGILSNAEDLVKFGNAILFSDFLSDEIKTSLFETITLKEGYPANLVNGWIILSDRDGRKIYGRSGNVTGGGAALMIFPQENLVVAGAVNLTADIDEIPVYNMATKFLTQKTEEQAQETKDTIPE